MQGVAWLLPMLDRTEHQWAVEGLAIDPPIAEPTTAASLPAGRQAASQRNGSLLLVKTDGLAEQQTGDHPAQEHQMAFVADRAMLTQEVSSAWSGAWKSTRDWFGVRTPTSHGSLPTQWIETHSGARAYGRVSVSQVQPIGRKGKA